MQKKIATTKLAFMGGVIDGVSDSERSGRSNENKNEVAREREAVVYEMSCTQKRPES